LGLRLTFMEFIKSTVLWRWCMDPQSSLSNVEPCDQELFRAS
jgi:hypothetical protein